MVTATEPDGFPATDPRGIQVHCRLENWQTHERRHPEIVGRSSVAAETIARPVAIYRSHQQPAREVYYRSMRFPAMKSAVYMRVITDSDVNGLRWIVSAHAARRPDRREVLIWP